MTDAARSAGCPVAMQVVPGSKHAFAYFGQVAPSIFEFIRSN
jgi:hypothetical protein